MKSTVLVLACMCIAVPVSAQQSPPPQSSQVLKQIAPPSPTGEKLEARVVSITFPPGYVGGWHSHPTPPVIYVTEGTLTVEIRDKDAMAINAGQTAIEPVNTVMRATNKGTTPTRIVIFQMSPPDLPDARPAQ